jgi:GNAT superfamily N-acetyltransferase
MTMLPRCARPRDCERVLAVIDEWWGGPTTSSYLPSVFFSHPTSTSFVLEASGGVLVGFLLGFLSQVRPDEACAHAIGVHPAFRRPGFGRRLYERFFVTARMGGRRGVPPVTFVRRIVFDAPDLEASRAAEAAVTALDAEVLCDVDPRAPLAAAARVPDRDGVGERP